MELEKVKADKATEMLYLLELFDGKLSLNDILNTDLPLLSKLMEAKRRLIEEQKHK